MPLTCVLEGGTDAASMVLFDPEALPEDFDIQVRDDPAELIERLDAEGRLCGINPAADGGYSLGVCVDSGLPKSLVEFARPLAVVERFAVPGGRLHFAGIEYVFRRDDSMLRRYPHMGSSCEVPPGTYRMAVYEMEYPAGLDEAILRGRLPAAQYRLYEAAGWLTPLGCLGAAVVVALLALFRRVGGLLALVAAVAVLGVALGLSRSKAYREADHLFRSIRREHPVYVVALSRLDPDGS